MDELPLVSVVMLAYRHEHYIAQAIESVLGQKASFGIELIIGEDGSPDETLEICRRYERLNPDRMTVISTGENVSRGTSCNFYRTCLRCRGKYVAMCEGDDYWTDPDKLQKQVDFMESNPDCAVCFHPVIEHWEDGSLPDSVYPADSMRFSSCPPTLHELLRVNYMHTNSVMYRWNVDGRLFDDFPLRELPGDWKLNLLHAQHGRIGFLPDVMAVYRRHSGGLWVDAWENSEWFRKCGFRNALFYAWVQRKFAVNRRSVLRRLALATLAQLPSGQEEQIGELLEIARPSPLWVRLSGFMALCYGLVARFVPGAIGAKAKRYHATWAIIHRGRSRILPFLRGKAS